MPQPSEYDKKVQAIKSVVLTDIRASRDEIEIIVSDRGGYELRTPENHKMVVHQLVKEGYLDSHYADYATTFLALRAAWLAPVAYKASSLCDYITSFFDGTSINPSEVYDAICRQLQKHSGPVIVWSATTLSQSSPIKAITAKVCHDAYLDLERTMDAVNQETKKQLRQGS